VRYNYNFNYTPHKTAYRHSKDATASILPINYQLELTCSGDVWFRALSQQTHSYFLWLKVSCKCSLVSHMQTLSVLYRKWFIWTLMMTTMTMTMLINVEVQFTDMWTMLCADVDICSSVTCMNGGKCSSDARLGFVCHCTRHFSGRYCTTGRNTGQWSQSKTLQTWLI